MKFKRIKTITSYAGQARYFAVLSAKHVGFIPTPREIPSPYAYSPSTVIYRHKASGKLVFMKETRHRRFEWFEVPGSMALMTDKAATEAYLAGGSR